MDKKLEQLSASMHPKTSRPTKIMQFGEGNFLRAFADWIVGKLNDNGYDGGVVVVQPQPHGRVVELAKQDGLYTLYMQGIENGQAIKRQEIVDVLDDFINPYAQYDKYLDYASSQDLQTIISNTTEAGIVLDQNDIDFDKCPNSYPGKLLAFLYARYQALGDKGGLNIIPCELIDDNGQELRRVLLELAKIKDYDSKFVEWLGDKNRFCNTLVDRIVPGFPKDQIEELNLLNGYTDNSAVMSEVFHLWVLQDVSGIKETFPVHKCGCNCLFVDDITPYKQRKVKILNGSHTALTPVAYLAGFDTVRESVEDSTVGSFLDALIKQEINPTIDLSEQEKAEFGKQVLDRYKNPFIRHELMSIALNSTSKFCTRLVPSIKKYIQLNGTPPKRICFALAAFLYFHRGKRGNQAIALNDDKVYLQKWADLTRECGNLESYAKQSIEWLGSIWQFDLSPLLELVTRYIVDIDRSIINAIAFINDKL